MDRFKDAAKFRESVLSGRHTLFDDEWKASVYGVCYYIASSSEFRPKDRVVSLCELLPGDHDVEFGRDNLWPNAGVYVFYDDVDVVYIGQTLNAKKRVSSHSAFSHINVGVFYMEERFLLSAEALAIGIATPVANFDGSDKYIHGDLKYNWRSFR